MMNSPNYSRQLPVAGCQQKTERSVKRREQELATDRWQLAAVF
jgi:hypothetical protein